MMYHKFIGDREVFSDCKTIQTNEGVWISNPSEEQIAAAGWLPYTPPEPPAPEPQTEPDMDQIVEAVKKMLSTGAEQLSDEDAIAVAAIFPTWASLIGTEVEAGKRIWDDGELWKVLQPHTIQESWRPSDSPSLFVKVSIEEIPEWVQPGGSTDAYNKGDKVKHNGGTWISGVDGNVWEPGVYGWEEVG